MSSDVRRPKLNEPIRTLHIMTSLDRRGAETFAVQVIDRLDRERFSPGIWTTRSAAPENALVPQHTPVFSTHDHGHAPSARALRELVHTLRLVRPHLVQCHGGIALTYATAVKLFYKAPAYVYTKISSIHPALDSALRRRIYGILFNQVDAIVAGGEEVRREVEEEFHPRRPRLLTISNGRDVQPFLNVSPELVRQTRQELGLATDDVCLMAVGGLVKVKDPEFVLRLYADLLSSVPTLRLVFVGSGPMEPDLRRQASTLRIDNQVRFLGVRSDVPRLMFAADILVLPSISEGLPGVLIEAGMAGRPAVAFKVGAVTDVLDDGVTGYVVMPRDQDTFRDRVARLARDPALRATMGEEAMRRCRRDFDVQASIARYEHLFTELVEQLLPRRVPVPSARTNPVSARRP